MPRKTKARLEEETTYFFVHGTKMPPKKRVYKAAHSPLQLENRAKGALVWKFEGLAEQQRLLAKEFKDFETKYPHYQIFMQRITLKVQSDTLALEAPKLRVALGVKPSDRKDFK